MLLPVGFNCCSDSWDGGGGLGLPGRVMLSFHLEFDQAGTVFLRCSQIMQ